MIHSESLNLPFIKHAFFTRQGGISEGLYASLNCRLSSKDQPSAVQENRARAMENISLSRDSLITLAQIHSADVVVVDRTNLNTPLIRADAMVTKTIGLCLGILTADCMPILMVDIRNKVIAAIHAGWRGASQGIIQKTLSTMNNLGCDNSEIRAVIGPCIQQKSYQVGPEFPGNFSSKEINTDRFFKKSKKTGYFQFNLPEYAKSCFQANGVSNVSIVDHDTCSEEHSFFSYRRSWLRSEEDYGCQLSAISLVG